MNICIGFTGNIIDNIFECKYITVKYMQIVYNLKYAHNK